MLVLQPVLLSVGSSTSGSDSGASVGASTCRSFSRFGQLVDAQLAMPPTIIATTNTAITDQKVNLLVIILLLKGFLYITKLNQDQTINV